MKTNSPNPNLGLEKELGFLQAIELDFEDGLRTRDQDNIPRFDLPALKEAFELLIEALQADPHEW